MTKFVQSLSEANVFFLFTDPKESKLRLDYDTIYAEDILSQREIDFLQESFPDHKIKIPIKEKYITLIDSLNKYGLHYNAMTPVRKLIKHLNENNDENISVYDFFEKYDYKNIYNIGEKTIEVLEKIKNNNY